MAFVISAKPQPDPTPSKEAQELADYFLSELEAEKIADPSFALALLIQGARDGADARAADRIAKLEGHRKQWRSIAFRLLEMLDTVDAYADYPESVAERLREVRAIFEERSSESNTEDNNG